MQVLFPNPETGGAALEYIIVSIFGLLLAVAAIAFVGQAAKEKLKGLEDKLGIQFDTEALNPFGT
ncbi:MAG: hypothetical protein ACOVS5_09465 [Oligoflexus sp.]|jgi:hypothetical protein